MSVLKIKDGTGQWIAVPSVKGEKGDTYSLTNQDKQEIANLVETSVLIQNVSGTDPVITAQDNYRYICGEVATLNFTPCVSGICDVKFTSGSTATELTLPSTAVMPDNFIVEANRVYELNFLDGMGVCQSWPIPTT